MASFVSSPCMHRTPPHSLTKPYLCSSTFTNHGTLLSSSSVTPSHNPIRRIPTASKSGRRRVQRRSVGSSAQVPKTVGADQLPEDGTPIFNIFVRTARAKIWYPVCAVSGDDQSKRLVNALKSSWGRTLYKNAIDRGLAKSLYEQNKGKMMQAIARSYPHLKKHQNSLEYGYKIMAKDLEEQPTVPVTRDMALPFFQWIKKKVGDIMERAKSVQQES